jgi:PAS domain S-box-containing protein
MEERNVCAAAERDDLTAVATDRAAQVRAEQIRTLYKQAAGNYVTTLVTSCVVAYVLWNKVPLVRVGPWFAAAILITLARFYFLRKYRRGKTSDAQLEAWGKRYTVGSAAAGILWGASAFLLFAENSIMHQAFLFVVIAGMMAGAALSLNSYLPTFYAFILPIGALFVARMGIGASFETEYGQVMLALSVLLAWWTAAIYFFGRIANNGLTNAFRLSWDNRALNDRLAAKMRELEETNHTLEAQIEARARVESELQRNEERYRQLVEHSPDAIFINRGETIGYANAAALRLLGATSVEQVVGSSIFRFIHPDEHAEARARIAAQYRSASGTGLFERRYVRLDGSIIDVEMSGVPIVDDTGPARHMIVRDVSARRRMEAALRESEQRLRLAVEASGVALFDWDVASDEVYLGAGRMEMPGYASAPMRVDGAALAATVHAEDVPRLRAHLVEVLKGKADRYRAEHRVRTAAGDWRWIQSHGAVIARDAQGRATRVVGFNADITDRKKVEETIMAMNVALTVKADELAAANKELDAFAYTVSHDLRAPVRHISGFVNLLERRGGDALDPESKHFLDRISQAAKRMGLLIDGLLEFSRMGRTPLVKRQISLEQLVAEVVEQVAPDTRGRNIEWEIGRLPEVFGDHNLLRQAFFNLIDNAVKYTRGQSTARIEIACVPGNETEAVVMVRDNGAGFDEKYHDKLFGVFQRLHSSEEFEGTGIGLASVARVIQRHGGRVWAEGEKGRGAAFFVSIPLDDAVH